MRVTVAICTFNRASSLHRTLMSLTSLVIPPGVDWEVLVVDNNSTDDTRHVIERLSARLPIRRLFEGIPGKSHAANLAVGEACGDLLLWTDDDVIVDRNWLREYVASATHHSDAAFFGGTVDPSFAVPPPAWIDRHVGFLSEPFALAQHGNCVCPLDDKAIVGANMALRTNVARQFRFNTDLGPVGTRALRGEETELLGRMRKAGYTGWWVGPARVQHVIGAERLTTAYLWHWYSGLGGHVAYREQSGAEVPRLFGAPRWAVKRYVQLRLKSAMLKPARSANWIRTVREAALMKGYIAATRRTERT